MAFYQDHNLPGSPEAPWDLTGMTLVSVTPDLAVFDNADGTQTRLNGSDLAFNPVADRLTGHVDNLTRTDVTGAIVYETLYNVGVEASALYPDTADAVDLLFGSAGNDVLIGGGGNDYLSGEAGDDLLDGGTGRDDMDGGAGDDTYVLRPGDGTSDFPDIESIGEVVGGGFDTVRIEGVPPWRVTVSFHSERGTLRLGIPNSEGVMLYSDIRTESYSDAGTDLGKRLERIVFDNGTVWDLTGPLTLTVRDLFYGSEYGDTLRLIGPVNFVIAATGNDIVHGSWGYDEIYGGEGDDLLEGGGGNDILYGGDSGADSGNDTFRGGDGNDYIHATGSGHNDLDGGAGNDSLDGGAGADVLVGGTGGDQMGGSGGDDLYIIRAGDGGEGMYENHEHIYEDAGGGVDTIHLEGLTPADVKLTMSPLSSNNLRLEIKAPDGSITYTAFSANTTGAGALETPIERITFDDGTVWDLRNGVPPLDDYAPHAADDTYTVEAGKTLIIDAAHGVLANDVDPDGDPLTFEWWNGPSYGTMVKNPDGSFSYTPNPGFIGEDGANYRIEANGLHDFGQIRFTVTASQSNAPQSTGDSGFSTAPGTPLTIAAATLLANDADADGDALTIVGVSDAVGGTVALDPSGNPVFTPNAGHMGPASFRYTVSDGTQTSTAQVQLTVEIGNPGNDTISGNGDDNEIYGGGGRDNLSGGDGADRLFGGSGDDALSGDAGNDMLDGGTGIDRMTGGAGDDTYVIRRGDGVPASSPRVETIFEDIGGGFDIIRIEGAAPEDVSVTSRSPGGMGLGIPNGEGELLYTYINALNPSDAGIDVGQRIERIVFDDGTIWDLTGAFDITGTDAPETIYGTTYDDTLDGAGGDDIINGASGNDMLRGGDDNDELWGGAGEDLLEGGAGDDRLYAGGGVSEKDILRGGDGDDELVAAVYTDILGSAGKELDGGAGNDRIRGFDGADVLIGGTGADYLEGYGGDDVYVIRAGDGGSGLYGLEFIYEDRGRGLDTIFLEGLTPDHVKLTISPATPGTLRLEITAPDGSVSYTEFWGDFLGNPSFYGERIELIKFGDGTVWDLRGDFPIEDYAPKAEADRYTVEAGETLIIDAAHGVLANDSHPDGEPLTVIWGIDPSNGTMVRNADGSFSYTPNAGFIGEDGLSYEIEANALRVTGDVFFTVTAPQPDAPVAADDSGFSTPADSPLTIAAGDLLANDTDADGDALTIVEVSDAMGGTVALDASGNPVFTPDADHSGPASFRYMVSDGALTLTAEVHLTVEEVGDPGDDTAAGGTGDDTLNGGAGQDMLSGGNGADRVNGGTGNDVLAGGNGSDRLLGGSGNDQLNGGNGDDLLSGGSGDDALTGGIGLDQLMGGAGDDTLSGGNGDDELSGSGGADNLAGGNGADRLEGGEGTDTLTGGVGADVFVFRPGFGNDTITDFRLTGAHHDVVEFNSDIFTDQVDMLASAVNSADGVLITIDTADTLLIENTTRAQLQAHPEDFHFV